LAVVPLREVRPAAVIVEASEALVPPRPLELAGEERPADCRRPPSLCGRALLLFLLELGEGERPPAGAARRNEVNGDDVEAAERFVEFVFGRIDGAVGNEDGVPLEGARRFASRTISLWLLKMSGSR
jgi:hypothetical protein